MNRTPFLVGGLFVAIVGAGAYWLGPRLLRRPPRTDPAPSLPSRPGDGSDPSRPGTRARPKDGAPGAARAPTLVVTTADGKVVPEERRRFSGPADDRGLPGTFVRAEGSAWTRLPPSDEDGAIRVRLAPAAPPLSILVVEPDGRPAPGVVVVYGPGGHASVATDVGGRAVIDGAEPGLLRLGVGAGMRAAAPVRVRMGVDTSATIALEPAWTIAVRVEDEAARAIAGARVRARGFDGRRAPDALTGADGIARVTSRVDERLALSVSAPGRETTAVELTPPDPRAPLTSDVTVRLVPARGSIEGRIDAPAGGAGALRLLAEPAVLAPLREVLGPEDVADLSLEGDVRTGAIAFAGLDPSVPWRLSLRGGVVPEDHVLRPDDPTARFLTLRPERIAPAARPIDRPGPSDAVALRGRVVDVRGAPLRGVTITASGRRALSDADGLFVLPGMVAAAVVDVTYGFADGADAGAVNATEFAPWYAARATVGDEPRTLVLPRAAALRARLTDGVRGTPLSWARIVVLDGDGDVRFDAPVATRDGDVRLEGLVPGTSGTLVALAPGLRRDVPLALKAGETVDAGEIGLVRAGRVTGTVKDRKGAPIPGAIVAAMEDGRVERGGFTVAFGRDLVLRRTRSDERGSFAIEGLDLSRPAALGIYADGYAPTARRALWTAEETATVSATLVRGGGVKLELFDDARERVPGAFVELEDARTGVRTVDVLRRAALGSFVGSSEDVRRASGSFLLEDPATPGVYRIGPVEPGAYEVIVTCAGFRPERAKLTVPDTESGAYRPIPADVLDWRLELTREGPKPPAPSAPGVPPVR